MSALETVFDEDFIRRLRRKAGQTGDKKLQLRYQVLLASGPLPDDPVMARHVRIRRAQKAAWEAYLDAAAACGLLDADLMGRLRDFSEDNARGAMAECLACWLLAGRLRLAVQPRPPGRDGCRLDLRVTDRDGFNVEAKAPARELPEGTRTWSGNDADVLVECLKEANRQFTDDTANLLVIVPVLRTPVAMERDQLVEAFIGHVAYTWTVPLTGDDEPTDGRTTFIADGKLVRKRHRPGVSSPLPDATRVSAVATVEERLFEKAAYRCGYTPEQMAEARDRGDKNLMNVILYDALWAKYQRESPTWIEHDVFVVHNPYALHRISEDVFAAFPQLVVRGGGMVWTDLAGDQEGP